MQQKGRQQSRRAAASVFSGYDLGQITQKADSIYETYLDLINTDREWVDRVRRATGESTRLTSVFEKWRERLNEVMSDSQPQDGQRVFSRQLKKEMFDANPICSICGNKISLIDDAALVLLQDNIAVFSVRERLVGKAPCAANGLKSLASRGNAADGPLASARRVGLSAPLDGVAPLAKGYGHCRRGAPCQGC